MPIVRLPTGAYDAAFPVTLPDGTTAYAQGLIQTDAAGNPVAAPGTPATSTRLAGATSATGAQSLGPFTPQLGKVVWVTLAGTWAGTVQLLRSVDGGTTKLPLTYGDGTTKASWTTNVNAPVDEPSVAATTYYLAVNLTSGTLSYRVEQ